MIELFRHEPSALAMLAASVLFFVLLVIVVSVSLLAHHQLSVRRERRFRADVRAVAAFLAPRLLEGVAALRAIDEARAVWGDLAVITVLRRIRQAVRGQIAETVARALERMGTVGELARTASSGGRARRVRALRLLGHCGGRQARAVLEAALDDESPEVRRAAREALPAIRDDRSLRAAMTSYLRDDEQLAAWRASFFSHVGAHRPRALGSMISVGALELENEKLALEALAEVGEPSALPLAVARLESPSAELRATAVRAVGKLQMAGAEPLLVPRLDDSEWIVRAAAARALGASPCGALACWALGERLSDSVWWVRANAAQTLAMQGEDGVVALLGALEAGDDFARESALAALALIDPERGCARRSADSVADARYADGEARGAA